jgi:CDP-4-dehydro-6-deoxyglucose reductase
MTTPEMTSIVLLPEDGGEPLAVLDGRSGEVVLDTLRRLGWSHRFGCRRGGCGVCKVDLIAGDTHDAATVADSVVTEDERAGGVRLSCRAVPDTDVVIRLRPGDQLRCVSPWLAGAGQRRI